MTDIWESVLKPYARDMACKHQEEMGFKILQKGLKIKYFATLPWL